MPKSYALIFTFVAFFLLAGKTIYAQTSPQCRLVIDLVSADTSDHAAILRQIRNLWKELPGTRVEIVMHGKALTMAQKGQTTREDQIVALQKEGVVFAVCRNTMKRYKLTESDFIPAASFVPAAIGELVKKQQEGWSYIKAGH